MSLLSPKEDKQWLVLVFVPAAWTPVSAEVIALSDAIDEFRDRKTRLVFVSTDSKYSLWAWNASPRGAGVGFGACGGLGGVQLPLVSDATLRISRAYGVLVEEQGLAAKGLFIIDEKQIVREVCEFD